MKNLWWALVRTTFFVLFFVALVLFVASLLDATAPPAEGHDDGGGCGLVLGEYCVTR